MPVSEEYLRDNLKQVVSSADDPAFQPPVAKYDKSLAEQLLAKEVWAHREKVSAYGVVTRYRKQFPSHQAALMRSKSEPFWTREMKLGCSASFAAIIAVIIIIVAFSHRQAEQNAHATATVKAVVLATAVQVKRVHVASTATAVAYIHATATAIPLETAAAAPHVTATARSVARATAIAEKTAAPRRTATARRRAIAQAIARAKAAPHETAAAIAQATSDAQQQAVADVENTNTAIQSLPYKVALAGTIPSTESVGDSVQLQIHAVNEGKNISHLVLDFDGLGSWVIDNVTSGCDGRVQPVGGYGNPYDFGSLPGSTSCDITLDLTAKTPGNPTLSVSTYTNVNSDGTLDASSSVSNQAANIQWSPAINP